MANVKHIIRDIENQKVAATGRRVLLVEGTDDVTAFQNFLSRKFPTWSKVGSLLQQVQKKMCLRH